MDSTTWWDLSTLEDKVAEYQKVVEAQDDHYITSNTIPTYHIYCIA